MPKESAFRRRYEEYRQQFSDLNGKTGYDQEYREFLDSVTTLNDIVNELYEAENPQVPPLLHSEQIRELQALYHDAMTKAETFIALPGKDRLDEKRSFLAEGLLSLMKRDIKVVGSLREEQRVTLADAFQYARTLRLDISGSPVKATGSSLSNRIPVTWKAEDGSIRRGFFTQDEKIMPTDEVLRRFREQYPEPELKEFWDVLDKADGTYAIWNGFASGHMLTGKAYDPFREHKRRQEWLENPRTEEILKRLNREYTQAFNYMQNLEATVGSDVADRNSAMTAVADLLGRGELLARSQKAVLIQDGVAMQGCIMEQAIGSDPAHLQKDDPLALWGANYREQRTPFSQDARLKIADLQVIDFICGNTDRHARNFLYQFDVTDKTHPVLSGIVGIDNDSTFGTYLLNQEDVGKKAQEARMNTVPLEDMLVITRSMADKVLSINGDTLDMVLRGYNLSAKERQAAVTRLTRLQEAIQEGLEYFKDEPEPEALEPGKIRTVADEDFNLLNTHMLAYTDNLYRRAQNTANEMIGEGPDPNVAEGKEPISYAGAVLGTTAQGDATAMRTRFRPFMERLDALKDAAFVWDSAEFRAMHGALKELMAENSTVKPEDAVYKVQWTTQNYINAKRNIPHTDKGKARLNEAKDLLEECVTAGQEMTAEKLAGGKTVPTFQEQMETQIRELQDAAKTQAAEALQKGDAGLLTTKVSEVLYLMAQKQELKQPGNGRILERLKPETMQKKVKEMRASTEEFLQSMPKAEQKRLVEGYPLDLHRQYLRHTAEVQEKQAGEAQKVKEVQNAKEAENVKSVKATESEQKPNLGRN